MRRLLLFDIDGTLVWGGPAKGAFQQAMVETFGTAGDIEVHSFAGKTDPQIARELLRGAGLPDADIEAGFEGLWVRYLGHLEEGLKETPMDVLPGVADLLSALDGHDDVALGLLTGNIAGGARLKLASVGLDGRFGVGSYGSDHEERDALPRIAMRRATETWGVRFAPGDTFIVGDTPRDVRCGLKEGLRTMAVATGHFDQDALRGAGAEHVLPDLTETEAVVSLLLA